MTAHVVAPRPVVPGAAAEPQTTGSSPLAPQAGGGTEEKMEQSVCGVETGAEKASADKTVNPAKGNLQFKISTRLVTVSSFHY